MGFLESEPDSGEIGVKVDGIGMKSGSFNDLNRVTPSPFSARVERSSLASRSLQSTSPTLVMAVESMIFAPVLGAAENGGAVLGLVVLGLAVFALAFVAGSTGAGGVAGTAMSSLHFGHGSV